MVAAEPGVACPRCGFAGPEGALECGRCGVIFARLRPAGGPGRPESTQGESTQGESTLGESTLGESTRPEIPVPRSTGTARSFVVRAPSDPWDVEARRALAWGFGLAVLVSVVPFLRFVLSYLTILVHELGHTACSWLFGYPALPAFDFVYGGGFSVDFGRSTPLLVILTGLLALGLFGLRRWPRAFVAGLVVVALWVLAAVSPLHEALILAMGHGAEAVFAGIFLYRAATGSATQWPEVERPLYAMVGFFIIIQGAFFALGLAADPARREIYGAAKGGGHMMDLSRLARDYLGTGLPLVALCFLLLFLAVPVGVYFVVEREP